MDHESVGRPWDENAEAWAKLVRAGFVHYHDGLNTPPSWRCCRSWMAPLAWFGCGEGYNTRLLSERGAHMAGIDISANFIRHAGECEEAHPSGIRYDVASAVELPFGDASFDFVSAFMSLMDIPETDLALAEAFRVLRPGSFFQFSITHPRFDTPHRDNLRDAEGLTYAIEVGDYFHRLGGEVKEWLFSAAGSAGGTAAYSDSAVHENPQRVAEPPDLIRLRDRTPRRTAPGRRNRQGMAHASGRTGGCLLSARQGA